MSDQPTTPLPAAVGALPGWRVVHFLRKPPWVREEPIAAFLVDGDGLGHPMVRDKVRSFVVQLNTKDEFVIAAPGEPAETFVEDAQQRAREHRQWLRETREQRKTEREIQQLRWELYRRARDFEASGRVVPRGHPAEALFSAFSLLHRGTEEGASRIALAWFLVEHCTFGAGQEVARSALEQRVDAFLDAYHLPRIESGALLRHLQRVRGIETFRFKNRVDGWKGLSLRPDPPREAYRPEDTDDQALAVVARVFIAHCVTQAASWQQGSVSQPEMMAAFRAWSVGYQVRPLSAHELSAMLAPSVMLGRKAGPDADRKYEGVAVRLPTGGQRVLDPGRRRSRRASA